MILRWLAALMVCFMVIGGLGFIKFTQVKAAIAFGESFPEPSETVETMKSTMSSWQAQIEVIGEVVSPQSVTLRNELEGIITEVNFKSGGSVAKGEVLIQFDVRDELAQLEGIKAEIRLAELEVERLQRLLKVNAGSEDQLDRAKAQRDIAKARSQSLLAVIAKKSIQAPFDGVAGLHQFEVGQFLTNNTIITELIGATDTMWIDFSLPQQYAKFAPDTSVKIRSIDESFAPLTAKITARSTRLSSQSRSLQVRATVDNSTGKLTAGEVVEVSVPQAQAQQVIRLPLTAIRRDSFGSFIYALNKDESNQWRAERKQIDIIFSDETTAVASSKLGEGLTIATTGSYKLRPGILTYIAGQ